jgi:hypothetical protein
MKPAETIRFACGDCQAVFDICLAPKSEWAEQLDDADFFEALDLDPSNCPFYVRWFDETRDSRKMKWAGDRYGFLPSLEDVPQAAVPNELSTLYAGGKHAPTIFALATTWPSAPAGSWQLAKNTHTTAKKELTMADLAALEKLVSKLAGDVSVAGGKTDVLLERVEVLRQQDASFMKNNERVDKVIAELEKRIKALESDVKALGKKWGHPRAATDDEA